MTRTRTQTHATNTITSAEQAGGGFVLSTAAKARELGKSEFTIRRWADAGKLQHIRDCNRNRLFRAGR